MIEGRRTEDDELASLLEAVYGRYGYDFRNYARASLKRRLLHRMGLSHLSQLPEMTQRIIHDEDFFNQVLLDLSVTVTSLFRDPSFYLAFRNSVVPVLKTYSSLKVWHAGCATGEEVYSMAILLSEEGLYDRTQIYATDYNNESLQAAKEGVYSTERVRSATADYTASGGKQCLSDYYTSSYGYVRMNDSLRKNVLFTYHNLQCDQVFGEMNVVICRNVLIYFDKILQERVISLFADSLCPLGFLCLGPKETLFGSAIAERCAEVVDAERIYRVKLAKRHEARVGI